MALSVTWLANPELSEITPFNATSKRTQQARCLALQETQLKVPKPGQQKLRHVTQRQVAPAWMDLRSYRKGRR
jgi:hypothetical protein